MSEFSGRGYLESNFRKMRDKLDEDDGQFIVLVVGETNTSKTSLSLLLDHFLNGGDVNLDTYAISHDRFMSQYTSRPTGKTIVFEEGRESFDKNKYSHTPNKEARDALRQYRKYQHTVFVNFQDASDLTPELPLSAAHCLIRTPGKGIAHFYGKRSMRGMWRGRSWTGWRDPDFKDYFPDPAEYLPELWSDYEEKAMERLDSSQDSDPVEEFGSLYSTGDVGERFGVTAETVRKWVESGDYEVMRLESNNRLRIPDSTVERLASDKLSEA